MDENPYKAPQSEGVIQRPTRKRRWMIFVLFWLTWLTFMAFVAGNIASMDRWVIVALFALTAALILFSALLIRRAK